MSIWCRDAYVVAFSPPLATYPNGQIDNFRAANANSGASTLNAGTPGAKALSARMAPRCRPATSRGWPGRGDYYQPTGQFYVTAIMPSQM